MFQVNDRIEVDRPYGQKVTATILEVEFRNSTYITKVRREDNGQEDVFAWNIYQDNISVRLAPPEPEQVITMTKADFDEKIAAATIAGFREGLRVARKNA